MQEILKELIEIDQKARHAVKSAQENSDALKEQIAADKDKVQSDYMARANKRIEKVREHAEKETQLQEQELVGRYDASVARLEKMFSEHKDTWVEQIVDRCIGKS